MLCCVRCRLAGVAMTSVDVFDPLTKPPCPGRLLVFEPYGVALATAILCAWLLYARWLRR